MTKVNIYSNILASKQLFRCSTFTTKQPRLGRPKEIAMLPTTLTLLLSVSNVLISFFILYYLLQAMPLKHQRGKEEKKKLSEDERISIIVAAIVRYMQEYKIYEKALCKAFLITPDPSLTTDKPTGVRNFIIRHIMPIPARLDLYQDLFDQVLKMYAEKMQSVYDYEDDLKKKHPWETLRNNLTRDEVERIIIKGESEIRTEKLSTEEKFWTLYDVLEDSGIKTFGVRSFRPYLALKQTQPNLPDPMSFMGVGYIGNMKIGESGYTVPWAMSFENNGKSWIDTNFEIKSSPRGTSTMMVTRLEDGYHTYPINKENIWSGKHGGNEVAVAQVHFDKK